MAFMQPVIDGPITVFEFENEFGETEYNYDNVYSEEELKEYNMVLVKEHKDKWLAYLSAPGYMDRTDYTMFDSEEEGKAYLIETFELCPNCMEELNFEYKCEHCNGDEEE